MNISNILIFVVCFAVICNFAYAVDVELRCHSAFQCISQTEFALCVDIGNNILVPTPTITSCPTNFICSDEQDTPCIQPDIFNPKAIPVGGFDEFECEESGKFPGPSCKEYYHCLDRIFWYTLKKKTCGKNLGFSELLEDCVPIEISDCK